MSLAISVIMLWQPSLLLVYPSTLSKLDSSIYWKYIFWGIEYTYTHLKGIGGGGGGAIAMKNEIMDNRG